MAIIRYESVKVRETSDVMDAADFYANAADFYANRK